MTIDSLEELADQLRLIARVPRLLVACDYDGTIAPITPDPMQAFPRPDAAAAMRSLALLDDTAVTVISGRSLRDLATLSRLPQEIRLVGSHGSEFDMGLSSSLPQELDTLRHRLADEVRRIGREVGALVEEKPTGVTFHLRQLDEHSESRAREALVRGPAGWDGVYTRNGLKIIEMSVIETNKGDALTSLREQVGATAVIFFGDDVTDEDAQRTLTALDLGIKVGDGPTAARYRVRDPKIVAQLLQLLSELRGDWLSGAGLVPISSLAVVSDQRSAAIVTSDARVNWMCAPRIDSSAVFAELLGGPQAGYFSVAPADGSPAVSQSYDGESLVVKTDFETFSVVDFMDVSEGRTLKVAGRSDLLRHIVGSGRVAIEFAPRVDFGRVATHLELTEAGVLVQGVADQLVLRAPMVSWTIRTDGKHQSAVGVANLDDGPVTLELRTGTSTLRPASISTADRQLRTQSHWRTWAEQLVVPELPSIGRHGDVAALVRRSALAIKSLQHGPTGAFSASVTTSLPSHIGGVRNWDQRYCWLRLAANAAEALVALGSTSEATNYLQWLGGLLETRTDPERLAPLYNVTGRHLPPEAELADIGGYGGSRPVRIGNAADGQFQLDIFGATVSLVDAVARSNGHLTDSHWQLVEQMVLAVSRRWGEPDHGVWELRQTPRHYVLSKTMCWLALERALGLSIDFFGKEPAAWVLLRDKIADIVISKGWNKDLATFAATLGGSETDAAALGVGLSGLVLADDDRFSATVAHIERELVVGTSMRRYVRDDGLPGNEAGHHVAMGWLVESLARIGRTDDAVRYLGFMCDAMGPLGLLSEFIDGSDHRALGNYPMLSAHTAFIQAALSVADTTA